MGSHGIRTLRCAAAAMFAVGMASAAHASSADLNRPVNDAELRALAESYSRGELGSGFCDWVHPVTNGPTSIPCEVVPLPVLANMARNVLNKHAQLELGKRFEEGRGVERDPAMARRYYRKASRDSQRGAPVLMAKRDVSPLGFGEAIVQEAGLSRPRVPGWPTAVGLPEAEQRLRALASAD